MIINILKNIIETESNESLFNDLFDSVFIFKKLSGICFYCFKLTRIFEFTW